MNEIHRDGRSCFIGDGGTTFVSDGGSGIIQPEGWGGDMSSEKNL